MVPHCVWIRLFGLLGEIAAGLDLWRGKSGYQMEVQIVVGLLSRLHVLTGIGSRQGVQIFFHFFSKRARFDTVRISVGQLLPLKYLGQ